MDRWQNEWTGGELVNEINNDYILDKRMNIKRDKYIF